MSKLEKLIAELCPDGVEYKTLGEIASISRGGNFQKKDFCDIGVPCIHYGQIYTRYDLFADKTITHITEECARKQKFAKTNDIVMAVTSENIEDVCKCIAWLGNEDVAVSGHSAIISHNQDPKYLVYYFHSQMFFAQKRKLAHGTKVIEITPDTLKSIKLPIPPLEVQREIVHILDSFTLLTAELIAKLTDELTARKKQYEFYRNELLKFSENEVENVPLGELYPDIRNGFVGTVTPFFSNKENGVLYLRGTNVHDGVINNEDVVYVSRDFHKKHIRTELKSDDIIMVQSGHVGECAVVGEGYAGANCHALIVMSNGGKCNSKYIVYYFHSYEGKKKLKAITTGGTVKHILASKMKQIIVPVPSLEVQNRLVEVLDNFDTICTDLNIDLPAETEARQKQYEYYRDLLLTFAEKGSTVLTDRQTDRQTELRAIKLIQYVFGYVMLPLSKICYSISSGKAKTKDNIGKYPVYGSTGIIAKTNEAVYNKTNILVARVGANAGYTHLAEGSYDVSDNTLIIDVKNEYNLKYVYYQLVNIGLNRYAKGGGQPLVTVGQIKEVVIAIPSMWEQERIVSILDRFDTLCNDLSAGLPAEIEARQKQYEYYRDKLLSFKELPK